VGGTIDRDADLVVVLDEDARPIGVATKGDAHAAPGIPHLAFSVVLTDPSGEQMLLQRRAIGAQHFAGAWSNSCCSHPRPGEGLLEAAERRIREELGVAARDLREVGSFWYEATDPASGRIEREHDVVIVGVLDAELSAGLPIDPLDVEEVRWWPVLRSGSVDDLGPVTPWLGRVLDIATASEALQRRATPS
jgi:isopentenyl-diphosphate delta-isomerase